MNLFSLFYIVPQGCSIIQSTLTGNLQGENKPYHARRYACMGYHYSQFVTFGLFCVFYGHKRQVLAQYLNSKDVIDFILKNLPVVFCFVFIQSSCCLLQGMIKALGFQGSACIYTFIGYYAIGLPLAYIMAFQSPYPEI